jgi:uncharacterized membrane protein YphA (DoxX/SURF4 family)
MEYLATQSEAIADYRHELGRTERMQEAPEADGVPFVERRIDAQRTQNRRTPVVWVNQVTKFDEQLASDFRNILTAEQKEDGTTIAAMDEALTSEAQRRLHITNIVVAALTVGVGICLLAGFFTRLASLVGALFLAAVIATQPPWVTGAAETYYQTIELAGLLVLAGTGAGRWAGLDYFGYAIWSRCCGRKC